MFQEAGPAALARMRKEGRYPAHTEEATRKAGNSVSKELKANLEWERENGQPDPAVFAQELLPGRRAVQRPPDRPAGLRRQVISGLLLIAVAIGLAAMRRGHPIPPVSRPRGMGGVAWMAPTSWLPPGLAGAGPATIIPSF